MMQAVFFSWALTKALQTLVHGMVLGKTHNRKAQYWCSMCTLSGNQKPFK